MFRSTSRARSRGSRGSSRAVQPSAVLTGGRAAVPSPSCVRSERSRLGSRSARSTIPPRCTPMTSPSVRKCSAPATSHCRFVAGARRPRAHPLHLRLHRHAQGRDGDARRGQCLPRVGGAVFRPQADDRVHRTPRCILISRRSTCSARSAWARRCIWCPNPPCCPRSSRTSSHPAQLTQWFSVPSAMTYMAKFGGLPEPGFLSLRRVLWCGEVLPSRSSPSGWSGFRRASFTNLYGPTETIVASAYYTVPERPGMTPSQCRSAGRAKERNCWSSTTPASRCPTGEWASCSSAGAA